MKPIVIAILLVVLYGGASTMEFNDLENRYNACIQTGSHEVYTDMEAELLEARCQSISGWITAGDS